MLEYVEYLCTADERNNHAGASPRCMTRLFLPKEANIGVCV